MALAVNEDGWPDDLGPLAERAIATAVAVAGIKLVGPAEVSVVLTDDAEQRALNRQWRGKDSPTNVLSFPQIEPFGPVLGLVGDIVLARQTVEQEAQNEAKPFRDHVAHLIVHGFLHLIGYDHDGEDEAVRMESLETRILAELGIADPYAEPAGDD